MDFTDFIALAPTEEYFYPPQDIYCEGREATTPLGEFVNLPSYFSYQSEIMMWRDGIQHIFPKTVSLGPFKFPIFIGFRNNLLQTRRTLPGKKRENRIFLSM